MKKAVSLIIFIFILASCSSTVPSRTKVVHMTKEQKRLYVQREIDENHINIKNVIAPDIYPEPIGGMEEVAKKLCYTKEAQKAKIEGRVLLLFTITEEGSVEDISVIRGLGYGLDEIAINAIKNTKFKPAEHKGEKTKVKTFFPVIFQLEGKT